MATDEQLRAAFLFRSQPTTIDSIELGCSISETHTSKVEVTEHPVEEGFAVTDHARPMPDEVSIEGLVTDTPLSRAQQRRTVEAFGITFESASEAEHIRGQPGYAAQAYAKLLDLHDHPRLITIVTELRRYENMLMTSLAVPRNKDVGDSLRFTASFKTVRIVSNKLTVAKKTRTAPKKVSTGKQVTKKTEEPTRKKSIAFQLADSLGLLDKLGIKAPPK